MIITKKYALELIRKGKAVHSATLKPDEKGRVYVAVDRLDKHRVDHYVK